MNVARCRALLVSAPASGQGKTTVTAALARDARRRGLRVSLFKTGPDFLDPMVLARASGAAVRTLDLWMVGEERCRQLLHAAARQSDLILVEGVMGLFDGRPSSADLARYFDLPILAVIDAAAMAQTFGAVALGLARYQAGIRLHGVVGNRVGSERHAQMLAQSLPAGIAYFGSLLCSDDYALPERHLGLAQPGEVGDLDARIDAAAEALSSHVDWESLAPSAFPAASAPRLSRSLEGVRIALAQDAAFAFVYPDNLDVLEALGARMVAFSPLAGDALPHCDAVYLPGGYPELHAERLAANEAFGAGLRDHHANGRPLVAECGGLMTLLDALVDLQGRRHRMAGVLPGTSTMQPRLQALGAQAWGEGVHELRGHTFHHSSIDTPLVPLARARSPDGGTGEAVFRVGSTTASYVHFYYASNPAACAALFRP